MSSTSSASSSSSEVVGSPSNYTTVSTVGSVNSPSWMPISSREDKLIASTSGQSTSQFTQPFLQVCALTPIARIIWEHEAKKGVMDNIDQIQFQEQVNKYITIKYREENEHYFLNAINAVFSASASAEDAEEKHTKFGSAENDGGSLRSLLQQLDTTDSELSNSELPNSELPNSELPNYIIDDLKALQKEIAAQKLAASTKNHRTNSPSAIHDDQSCHWYNPCSWFRCCCSQTTDDEHSQENSAPYTGSDEKGEFTATSSTSSTEGGTNAKTPPIDIPRSTSSAV